MTVSESWIAYKSEYFFFFFFDLCTTALFRQQSWVKGEIEWDAEIFHGQSTHMTRPNSYGVKKVARYAEVKDGQLKSLLPQWYIIRISVPISVSKCEKFNKKENENEKNTFFGCLIINFSGNDRDIFNLLYTLRCSVFRVCFCKNALPSVYCQMGR